MHQRFTLFSVFMAALFCGCGYDRFGDMQHADNQGVDANIGIKQLHLWYDGSDKIRHVYDDFVISGYVTAEDKSDNFYRTFIIQEQGSAIEIKAGIYDLHTVFPRGSRVSISIKNLDIWLYNGVLQLGCERNGEFDYIAVRYIQGEYFWPLDDRQEVSPCKVLITELTEDMCGNLVSIDGLQIVDPGQTTWVGERTFRDSNDNEIVVETSSYASFGTEKIPDGKLRITGILIKKPTRYVLKIRDLNDVIPGEI